ncbi:YlbG family protein [Terrilactibacillus laevilacticus]|uniref:YlbG family protein n=1 Tax=Terrilactibacillus laevilacticus TaxID=1380157 RepID=A0ABW5PQ36_9BACI|nr:YlbG family protein [Terrilactibacillus laevilacticus]
MKTKRIGLVVWITHLKYIRYLRRYGHVHYISDRMRYVMLYCDAANEEEIRQELKKAKYVKRIDKSHLQELKTSYEKKKNTGKSTGKEAAYLPL